jgi:hypothetical protein
MNESEFLSIPLEIRQAVYALLFENATITFDLSKHRDKETHLETQMKVAVSINSGQRHLAGLSSSI